MRLNQNVHKVKKPLLTSPTWKWPVSERLDRPRLTAIRDPRPDFGGEVYSSFCDHLLEGSFYVFCVAE